jgi:hypothetical protein
LATAEGTAADALLNEFGEFLRNERGLAEKTVWPASPSAIPHHWRHRLLTLQTTNHHRGVPTDHDALTHAAIYPDAVTLAAAILTSAASVSPVRPEPRRPQPGRQGL